MQDTGIKFTRIYTTDLYNCLDPPSSLKYITLIKLGMLIVLNEI